MVILYRIFNSVDVKVVVVDFLKVVTAIGLAAVIHSDHDIGDNHGLIVVFPALLCLCRGCTPVLVILAA